MYIAQYTTSVLWVGNIETKGWPSECSKIRLFQCDVFCAAKMHVKRTTSISQIYLVLKTGQFVEDLDSSFWLPCNNVYIYTYIFLNCWMCTWSACCHVCDEMTHVISIPFIVFYVFDHIYLLIFYKESHITWLIQLFNPICFCIVWLYF